MRLKTGDEVIVVAGKDKNKTGKITKILNGKVIVEGINIVKKHVKPNNNNEAGGIIEVENPIDASNVMLIDPKTKKPTRVGIQVDKNGKKVRVSKKSNEKID